LVNNAALGESGSLAEVDMDRVRRLFEVNLFSTLALTQVALRGMIARQRGTVVFISSIAGRVPFPFVMPYSMTKFALSAAAAGLRAEMDQLGKGIAVCVVEPGAIHTGFNQSMAASKYAWMGPDSYYYGQREAMQAEEKRTFGFLEAKSTASVVAKIVQAAEAKRPRLRYVAPWIQGLGVRLARMLGV
jgi:short-subunit dehydrogenase